MSTIVNSDTGEVSISDTVQHQPANRENPSGFLFDVPDQKSTLYQADNTRSEPLLQRRMKASPFCHTFCPLNAPSLEVLTTPIVPHAPSPIS